MDDQKKAIIKLLNTAKGQITGIVNMIENDKECCEISNQILASIAVLRRANQEIIKNKLECSITTLLKKEPNSAEELSEIVLLINKLCK